MSARRKYLIAALIALLWGAAMLAAFWWFEARYLRTFEGERAELFSGDALRLPAALLDAVKAKARARGIPYTRYVRMLLEADVAPPR